MTRHRSRFLIEVSPPYMQFKRRAMRKIREPGTMHFHARETLIGVTVPPRHPNETCECNAGAGHDDSFRKA
jgi:hypothetical protein